MEGEDVISLMGLTKKGTGFILELVFPLVSEEYMLHKIFSFPLSISSVEKVKFTVACRLLASQTLLQCHTFAMHLLKKTKENPLQNVDLKNYMFHM